MDKWDEMRTAYAVARLGTVSAAAAQLGIHRATVARHIDALEEALGGRLFQRHGRGYTPTEAGEDLLRVARATAEQFDQLAGRTQGRAMAVSGELVVTALDIVTPLVLPALQAFREAHPLTQVRYAASERMFKLEYGEAHVAIRAGERPGQPDNVVRPFLVMRSGLYAHQRYIDRHGRPESPADFPRHDFIQVLRGPFSRWSEGLLPPSRVVFSSADRHATFQALQAGMGIAFCPDFIAARDPAMIQVYPPDPSWDIPFWLVTHVDLHWTPKVQAILKLLRAQLPEHAD